MAAKLYTHCVGNNVMRTASHPPMDRQFRNCFLNIEVYVKPYHKHNDACAFSTRTTFCVNNQGSIFFTFFQLRQTANGLFRIIRIIIFPASVSLQWDNIQYNSISVSIRYFIRIIILYYIKQ